MAFPIVSTTANTLTDFLISKFGSDLYAVVPLEADATDKSGNANDFTSVGSPTFGSTDLVDPVKNALSGSMLGVFGAGSGGKYIRRQNTAGSGVVASMGTKGLTVIVFFKPSGGTNGFSTVWDFRRASGTAGRNGAYLQINNGAADGGESTRAIFRVVAAGGNTDFLEFDTAGGADGWWNDTDIRMVCCQYRKGDISSGMDNQAGVWVDGQPMTATASDLNNILTADTFTDSATAGDYMTFAGYYAGHYGAGGNYAYAIIIKRWITDDERYAIQQAACKTTPEGIPVSMNGAYDYDAAYGYATAAPGEAVDGQPVLDMPDRLGVSTYMLGASSPNQTLWRQDPCGRLGWSFDNQMQAQGGDGKWSTVTTTAPNGKVKRRGVLWCGSLLATQVLAQTWQRVLTYKGTSNRISFAVVGGVPVLDVNNTLIQPSTLYGSGATSGSISAISTAELLTASAVHGLLPGMRISITGTNSTPVFDGEYIVSTVPSRLTFTVAARDSSSSVPDVTVAGTAGTFVVLAGPPDKDLSLAPCVPQVGTLCWGTGRNGIVAQAMIGCGGRVAKGTTRSIAAGSYTNTLDVNGVVGFDAALSDEDGASMVTHRLVDVGRPLIEEDYARFHWFQNLYLNPKNSTEYAAAVALLGTYYQSLSGHIGVRDIGLTIGGTSLECATPDSGYVTQNRGWQGRFSAAFTRRLAYVTTIAVGGNLSGPNKNIDGTAQSGFGTNLLSGSVDWTTPGITAYTQRGPITHVLLIEPFTNDLARAAAAPNSGADISQYGSIQSAEEIIERWKNNNPTGTVFVMMPDASWSSATNTSLIAWAASRVADGTIANYLIPTAKASLHWSFAEQAAEAVRIEAMIEGSLPIRSTALSAAYRPLRNRNI